MGVLSLPSATGDLVLQDVTVPSGYVNYFLLAHSQLANSGELLSDFLVRQVVYQSVERYAKYVIQLDYERTIASGQYLEQNHGGFVTNTTQEEQNLLGEYNG